jgi:hypothetical protein
VDQKFIDWAIAKFSPITVLLPVPGGQKGCKLKGWSRLTPACMTDPRHLAKLRSHGNLGVGLGPASGNLGTIDIDLSDAVEPFLARNPRIAPTLRSYAVRGCNLWVRIIGECPPSRKIELDDGQAWGEWRAAGNQTIIAGTHPSGVLYRLHDPDAPVVQVRFDEIVWPDGASAPRGGEGEGSSSSSPLRSTVLGTTALSATVLPTTVLQSDERLLTLYARYVAPKALAISGRRNDTIRMLVPHLVHAVDVDTAVDLLLLFFDRHACLWNASRDRHAYEARNSAAGTLATFEASLNADEREIYQALPDHRWQAAFRICRSLAFLECPGSPPPPVFFLARSELELRIGVSASPCRHIFEAFKAYGVLDVDKAGVRRTAGVKGETTHYRWML